MKRQLTAALVASVLFVPSAVAQERLYQIGILSWARTPYFDEAVEQFRQAFHLPQLPHHHEIVSAQRSTAEAEVILQRWHEEGMDLVFVVGTEPALLAVREMPDTPIIFVADPVPSLVPEDDNAPRPHPNATGSSTRVDMGERLRLFREAMPELRNLGVVYNADDPVAAGEVAEAHREGKALCITLREATVTEAGDVLPAVKNLIRQNIDALWIPTDALVCGHITEIARLAQAEKLPLLAGTPPGMVTPDGEHVALVAVAADYGQLGRLSAKTALEILTEGKVPADIPIRRVSPHVVVVNGDVAAALDYTVPPPLLAKAHRVVRGYEGQVVTIAGTGDCQDLLRTLAKKLLDSIEGGQIDVPESIGSSGGIRALLAGKTDLARVARELKPSEVREGLTCLTFARSPIAFVVHPGITGIDNITSEEIVGIYSGKISKWEQLNARSGRIYALTREPGDSSLRVLHTLIPALAHLEVVRAKVLYSTPEARDALVGHRNTFGFLPMSVAIQTNLRVLAVDGVLPSVENVRDGSYKLVVPFNLVYKDEPTGLARRFVEFLFSQQAQEIITATGTVPVDRATP